MSERLAYWSGPRAGSRHARSSRWGCGVPAELVRAAEVITLLCLATDLGTGFPFEHGLAATLTTMRLCDAVGVDTETARVTYYVSLLMYSGCTVDAEERSGVFGGSLTRQHTHRQHGSQLDSLVGIARALPSPEASLPRRTYQVVTRLPRARAFALRHFGAFCEVAGMLAERLGLPGAVSAVFPYLSERWDGASVLGRARAEDVPLPLRITHVVGMPPTSGSWRRRSRAADDQGPGPGMRPPSPGRS
jgi:hypothetical protein